MKKRILFTAAALVCAANLTAQCLGVGSSTSSMSPEEMAAAAKAGVEYVEIGISGRGTVAEIREKALHAKRMADEAGLKVWSCHLPFSRKLDISVLNDSARMANLEFLTEMIAICGEVGPEKLVLHPSSEPIADGEREQRIRNSIASIGILRREAARIGAQLCIEDLPRTCLGRNSAELLRIIAPYPEVKSVSTRTTCFRRTCCTSSRRAATGLRPSMSRITTWSMSVTGFRARARSTGPRCTGADEGRLQGRLHVRIETRRGIVRRNGRHLRKAGLRRGEAGITPLPKSAKKRGYGNS